MTEAERRAALEQVAAEVRDCTRCRLHEGRTLAVPGEGHPSTEVLFVGEGPGLNEDRQGRPFVGAAGQFLTELLGTVGWRREDVFITNVVKCRPPQNRDPEPDEIEACAPFLRRQLDALDPALVVTLGRHSMGRFMPGARIGQVHGTFRSGPAELGADRTLVFAMYHPAAALHQASLRQTLLADMAEAPAALLEARRRRSFEAEASASNAEVALAAPLELEQPAPEPRALPVAIAPELATAAELEPPAVEAMLQPEADAAVPETAAPEPASDAVAIAITPEATASAPEAEAAEPGTRAPGGDRPLEADEATPEPMLAAIAAAGDQAPPDDQMTLF